MKTKYKVERENWELKIQLVLALMAGYFLAILYQIK